MSKFVSDATESKKTKKNWLLTTVDPSLNLFSKLPNHVLMSLVLLHLDAKDLHKLPRVSKSFSGVMREFKKTASARKNLEQFLRLELRMLAHKQKAELKDMPISETLSTVEHAVEVKSNEVVVRARRTQSSIYEYAVTALCIFMGSNNGGGGAGGSIDCTRRVPPISPLCECFACSVHCTLCGFFFWFISGN